MSEVLYESSGLPLLACFLLSGLFVGSLYVWDSKHHRDHPSTIKQRFCSVFVVILISPIILKLFISSVELKKFTILELIGFRSSGLLPAIILPLFLTMVLFLGPLSMLDFYTVCHSFIDPRFWTDNLTNLIWIRNTIIGPLAEEFTYRACMMPLLVQCYKPVTAVFICSLFFGLAHVHHVIERYKVGEPFKILAIRAVVQFSYTTLFGAYSSYVFLKTGHFVAPFLVHAFCNIMAFPDFAGIFAYENPKKMIIMFCFVAGVVLWYFLLDPLLNHELYNNFVYFNGKAAL